MSISKSDARDIRTADQVNRYRPTIQIWSAAEAPPELAALEPDLGPHGWIALVPLELRDDSIVSYMRQSGKSPDAVTTTYLLDGSLLLAGH
jgi:hypothetical protein